MCKSFKNAPAPANKTKHESRYGKICEPVHLEDMNSMSTKLNLTLNRQQILGRMVETVSEITKKNGTFFTIEYDLRHFWSYLIYAKEWRIQHYIHDFEYQKFVILRLLVR